MKVYLCKWEQENEGTGEWDERVCVAIANSLEEVKTLLKKSKPGCEIMEVKTDRPRVVCPYLD